MASLPVVVGTAPAIRDGTFEPVLFLLAIIGSALVLAATNLGDEYFDYQRNPGVQKYAAPHKVIALGLLSPKAVFIAMWATYGVATSIGSYLIFAVGWPLLPVCLAAFAASYLYSGGPKPLGDLGMGEPLLFIFMGPVSVMASFYVQTGILTWEAFWVSLPMALLAPAILVINGIRDEEEDRQAHKITPAVVLGKRLARWLYNFLIFGSFLPIFAIILLVGVVGLPVLVVFLTFPKAVILAKGIFKSNGTLDANGIMAGTASLHRQYAALLAVGLIVGRFV